MESDLKDLKDVMTETELIEFLAVKKSVLKRFRQEGLPFCRLSRYYRVYLVKDVLGFISRHRMILSETERQACEE